MIEFDPDSNYPKDNFIVTSGARGEIHFDDVLLKSFYVKSFDLMFESPEEQIFQVFGEGRKLVLEKAVRFNDKDWHFIDLGEPVPARVLSIPSQMAIDNIVCYVKKKIFKNDDEE